MPTKSIQAIPITLPCSTWTASRTARRKRCHRTILHTGRGEQPLSPADGTDGRGAGQRSAGSRAMASLDKMAHQMTVGRGRADRWPYQQQPSVHGGTDQRLRSPPRASAGKGWRRLLEPDPRGISRTEILLSRCSPSRPARAARRGATTSFRISSTRTTRTVRIMIECMTYAAAGMVTTSGIHRHGGPGIFSSATPCARASSAAPTSSNSPILGGDPGSSRVPAYFPADARGGEAC